MSLATYQGRDTDQLDIKSAFLNGDLVQHICMILTSSIGLDGKILLLDKTRYGLKQVPLAWIEKVSVALAEREFISVLFDRCVLLSADHKMM